VPLVPQLRHLIEDVFTHGYVAALRPALALSAGVLPAGAVVGLLLRRTPAPVVPPAVRSPLATTSGRPSR
jgi:hypothetical protein